MRYSLAFAGLAAAQVSSIIDGQPQAPTAAMGALSSIVDGQPQAPATAAAAISSIVDGQPQAPPSIPTTAPVAPGPAVPMKTTTTYVTHLTTYCPAAGTSTFGSKTYTVTKPTTLTVLDCSCTLTNTVPIATPSAGPISYSNGTTLASVPAAGVTGAPGAPKSPLTSTVFVSTCPGCPATVPVVVGPTSAPAAGVAGPAGNSTAPLATGAITAAPAKFTGAASKVSGAGAGLAAVFGLAAYLL